MTKIFRTDSDIHKKFEEVFQKMNDLGITFPFIQNAIAMIDGVEFNGEDRLEIIDAEDGRQICEFPPVTDFRVKIFDT
jgi:hypothetical protein